MNKSNEQQTKNRSMAEWQQLTDRYFEAETSLKEEAELRRFLLSPESAGTEFDEIRAVFGYVSVGKKLKQPKERPAISHRYRTWSIAASFLLCLSVSSGWFISQQKNNQCVAYIYGEKYTKSEIVLEQMQNSFLNVQEDTEELNMKNQLSELFGTLGEIENSETQE